MSTSEQEKEKKSTLSLSSSGRLQLNKPPAKPQQPGFGGARSHKSTVTVEVRSKKPKLFTAPEAEPKPSAATEKANTLVWKKTDAAQHPEDKSAQIGEAERQRRLQLLKHAGEESSLTAKDPSLRDLAPRRTAAETPVAERTEELGGAARKYEVRPGVRVSSGEDEESRSRTPAKAKGKREGERRNSGKITVTQALTMGEERMRSVASMRRQREKARKAELGGRKETEKVFREVTIPEAITVQELANRMTERAVDVVKALMKMGSMVTVNQTIDADTAELIVMEFGHKPRRVSEADVEESIKQVLDDPESLKPRPPVVTIMGHVDHGKTSLLDALRKTDVVAGEAGGITQHIGAYQVTLEGNKRVTFLDTPGHEAFTAMRARGAKATDIVVLVVAADDGVKEQTKEAISHAKAAGVPIIVAINKIDKPGADATRVKTDLMSYELVAEDMGGETMMVEVSAKKAIGLDKLVETVLLQAEVMELKANPSRAAAGVVIEAKVDKGRGVVATLLVQRGTLNVGDLVVAGSAYGRVRAMTDDKNRPHKEALPAVPVEVQGLDSAPEAGDEFAVVENEKTARDITNYRKKLKSTQSIFAARSLDKLFAAPGKVKELPLIVKGDVQGSVEAILASLKKFDSEEVSVKFVHSGVGGITESDVTLANATRAIVIGFNVRANVQAKTLADRDKIDIRYYSIIYNLVDDVKAALSGMLSPDRREKFLGNAEIRQVFNITKVGKIAGCMVTEGEVKRGAKVRLLRDNVVIHEGTLKTLKRFKDEVKEVKSGFECGMAFENYDDIREKDVIEAFEIEEFARTVGDTAKAS